MRSKWLSQVSIAIMGLVVGAVVTGAQEAKRGEISEMQAVKELSWPLPDSAEAYASFDGQHLKSYVEELAAISRRYHDAGNRWWGRLVGMQSGVETQQWVEAKFRQAGLEVIVDEYDLRPQTVPRSWDVRVTGAGKTLDLTSAFPASIGRAPSLEGEMELDTVWVGLGMPSNFVGKDVTGKAVFIYSVPTPSPLIHSADWMNAIGRAQENGAAAIIVVLAIPGNLSYVRGLPGLTDASNVVGFLVGLDDGHAVESLNAMAAASGQPLKTHVSWKVERISGLKAANVIGVLRGQTDENIVTISHTDGYFEAANDNGAGTASLVGLAEYFAKRPMFERRRTMYFIAAPDHHGGDGGGHRVHDTMQDVLAKTAVILNPEHVALAEPVWDRVYGTRDPPELIKTNQLGPSWWGVYGSERLAQIVKESFAIFGVPTQLNPGGSPGELRAIQWDAPSFYLHNKGVYYHSSADTVEVVPAEGLRTAVQAFARIFDEVNQLELRELRPKVQTSSASAQ